MARIPIPTSLGIDDFSGGVINVTSSSATNAIFNKYPDGRIYATQRPSINIFEDASATVADAQGRGIYYWNAVGARYFVNTDTVYKGDYSGPLAATMTAGTDKVYFFEVGIYLVILDPENNQGWTISSAASTTLVEITDTAFPPKQTPALSLARGGSDLNGKLFVMATDGTIWNSQTENPTSWNVLNFLNAEISPDNGVMLAEMGQDLAAIGTNSLEFFYDNANPTGSPLSVRTDVDHKVGTVDFDTMWISNNGLFFVNLNPAGDCNVMVLNNFQLRPISNPDIDTFITSTIVTDNLKVMGSGFTAAGRSFYVLTTFYVSTVVIPLYSLVYDTSNGAWMPWEMMQTGIDDCPVIDWTRSTATRAGDGILSNGDIITIADDKNPQDLTEAQIYVVADYVEANYISDTGQTGDPIEMILIPGPNDFGTRNEKHMDNLRIVSAPEASATDVLVQWSDQSNNSYNTGRTLDLDNADNKLTRLGKFRSRNHKLTFSGTEQIEVEALEMDIE